MWRTFAHSVRDPFHMRTPLALLAALALVAGGASASLGADTTTTAPRTVDQGASVGTFDAAGRGVVILRGRLTAYGRIRGAILVHDLTRTGIVKVNGRRLRGRIVKSYRVYRIPAGVRSFYVRSRNVRVQLTTGRRGAVRVAALGLGRVVRLSGIGTYSLNNQARQSWASVRGALRIAP